jgi:hypothetical protein
VPSLSKTFLNIGYAFFQFGKTNLRQTFLSFTTLKLLHRIAGIDERATLFRLTISDFVSQRLIGFPPEADRLAEIDDWGEFTPLLTAVGRSMLRPYTFIISFFLHSTLIIQHLTFLPSLLTTLESFSLPYSHFRHLFLS